MLAKIRDIVQLQGVPTLSYYSRLLLWVLSIYAVLEGFYYIGDATVRSLQAVICYVILLCFLIYLKKYQPGLYDSCLWFCAPGNLFLRSWISLMFYVFLIKVPVHLAGVSPINIVSWICQTIFGNFVALGIASSSIGTSVYFLKKWRSDIYGDDSVLVAPSEDSGVIFGIPMKSMEIEMHDRFSLIPSDHRVSDATLKDVSSTNFRLSCAGRLSDLGPPAQVFENPLNHRNKSNDDDKHDSGSKNIEISIAPLPQVSTQLPDVVDNLNQPIVPTMMQLAIFWSVLMAFSLLVIFCSKSKPKGAVICFQLSTTYSVFILCSTFRMRLMGKCHWVIQSFLQPVVIFMPVMIFIVIFTSQQSYLDWIGGLNQYLTLTRVVNIANWGAGDFVGAFLNTAFVSFAFASVDCIVDNYKFLVYVVPAMIISCILIVIQTALVSRMLQSPKIIALPLLTRCTTTPVAIALSHIIDGATPELVAASSVLNTVVAYRTAPFLLNLARVTNPIVRGTSVALSGTLLGVVGLGENDEKLACGIGMAGYGLGTIMYSILFTIFGFRIFASNLT